MLILLQRRAAEMEIGGKGFGSGVVVGIKHAGCCEELV